jgi:hypothetical protein
MNEKYTMMLNAVLESGKPARHHYALLRGALTYAITTEEPEDVVRAIRAASLLLEVDDLRDVVARLKDMTVLVGPSRVRQVVDGLNGKVSSVLRDSLYLMLAELDPIS